MSVDLRGHPIIKMGVLEFVWTDWELMVLYGGMKLIDEQWELIEPLLPANTEGHEARATASPLSSFHS